MPAFQRGNANAWFDLVQADLEAMGYAFGIVPFPSAGVGSPHIRDRAYWVANPHHEGLEGRKRMPECSTELIAGTSGVVGSMARAEGIRWGKGSKDCLRSRNPSQTNGFWRDADWLFCRDEKWRPVRPGSFPLVDGATARVGRLRAYGNAINAEAAKVFIAAYLDSQRAEAQEKAL